MPSPDRRAVYERDYKGKHIVYEKIERSCLKCSKYFIANGLYNRICKGCTFKLELSERRIKKAIE